MKKTTSENKELDSKGSYEYIKFDISDCYKDYQSGSNHFSYREYKLIIKTFLRIYFYEAYFLKNHVYFFFGGRLIKNKIPNKIVKSILKAQNNRVISIKENVGLLWFNRPFPKFKDFIFKKLVGTGKAIKIIEKEWLKENDTSFLPTLDELYQNGKRI